MLKLLSAHGVGADGECRSAVHGRPTLVAAVEGGQPWAVHDVINLGADVEAAREYIRQHGEHGVLERSNQLRGALAGLL